MYKLGTIAQLSSYIILLLLYLSYLRLEPEVNINACIADGLWLLPSNRQPELEYSLLLQEPIQELQAKGAILYAVPVKTPSFDNIPNDRTKRESLTGLIREDIQGSQHGQILWQRKSYTARPTASMTKVMSLLLALEYLDGKDINETIIVPQEGAAARRPFDAAVVGLVAGQKLTWADLLAYAIVASANDAIYALAVLIGQRQSQANNNQTLGESAALAYFVRLMNQRAMELGLSSAHFVDPDGWSKDDRISPFDMARLAAYYSAKFPQALRWHRQQHITIGANPRQKRQKANTNRLLPHYREVEGLKTGFTYEAGFNFTAIARRGNWRYIAVVMGIENKNVQQGLLRRAAEAETLLDWGLRNFYPLESFRESFATGVEAKFNQLNARFSSFSNYLRGLIANAGIYVLAQQRLQESLAVLPQQLGPHLLPVFPRMGQGLISPSHVQKERPTEKLTWHLYWSGAGLSYGEIRQQGFAIARLPLDPLDSKSLFGLPIKVELTIATKAKESK